MDRLAAARQFERILRRFGRQGSVSFSLAKMRQRASWGAQNASVGPIGWTMRDIALMVAKSV
jgi:hypothetical protein